MIYQVVDLMRIGSMVGVLISIIFYIYSRRQKAEASAMMPGHLTALAFV